MMKKYSIVFAAVLILGAAINAHSQAWRGRGRVTGSVKDSSGAGLEGVTIKFASEKLQTSTQITSDKKGNFVMAGIHGGDWDVDFAKEGYKTHSVGGYHLSEYDYNQPINVVLEKASASTASGGQGGAPKGPDLSAVQAGRDLEAQKDYTGAIAKYNEALTANPTVYQIYGDIGKAYYDSGNMDKALESYQTYLDKEKAAGVVMPNQQVELAMVGIYLEKKDFTNAKKLLAGIDESTVTDPTIFYNLGVSYTNSGDIDNAIKYFQKSVTVDPKFSDG
ncbi:MAG TPA: tetratricopeptide repeat protein, partial [Acidobacteriota bacterium]|nr:tetratricopeptide repeat protein [Acidobacteriota bacterium]